MNSFVSRLPMPAPLLEHLIYTLFPSSGLAITCYQFYAWLQAWLSPARAVSRGISNIRNTTEPWLDAPSNQRIRTIVIPSLLAMTAALWVLGTFVVSNFVWSFFITDTATGNTLNNYGTTVAPAPLGPSDFSAGRLLAHWTPASKVMVAVAVAGFLLTFVSRAEAVGQAFVLVCLGPPLILGLFMAFIGLGGFAVALLFSASWQPFLLAVIVLGALGLYTASCFAGLTAAERLGDIFLS